jgi:maltooligosyltrehalose trehalohydrolase
MCKLLAGAVFVSPFIPMLFMGEEYAETNPFQFFISHTDRELAALVNKGRKEEFASFNWQGEAPDPRLEETFDNSMLQWRLLSKEKHQRMLGFYKQIIRLKKEQPALRSGDRLGTNAYHDDAGQVVIVRRKGGGQEAFCILNFAGEARQINLPPGDWNLLIDSAAPEFGSEKTEPKNENKVSAESIRVYARNA